MYQEIQLSITVCICTVLTGIIPKHYSISVRLHTLDEKQILLQKWLDVRMKYHIITITDGGSDGNLRLYKKNDLYTHMEAMLSKQKQFPYDMIH